MLCASLPQIAVLCRSPCPPSPRFTVSVHSVEIDEERIVSCKYFVFACIWHLTITSYCIVPPVGYCLLSHTAHCQPMIPVAPQKVLLHMRFSTWQWPRSEANLQCYPNVGQFLLPPTNGHLCPCHHQHVCWCQLLLHGFSDPLSPEKPSVADYPGVQVLDITRIGLVFEIVSLNQILGYYTMRTMLLLAQPLHQCPPLCPPLYLALSPP